MMYDFGYAQVLILRANTQITRADPADDSNPIPEAVVNQWLAGELPANDPAAARLNKHPGVDPWGNPLVFKRRLRLADGRVESVAVFSRGRDGVSRSRGNDPDDLNSWDETCNRPYIAEINRRNRIYDAAAVALLTPFVYLGLLAIRSWFRRINARESAA